MTDYIGKKVKIIGNFGGHFFKNGEIVRIVDKEDYDQDYGQTYKAEHLDGHDYWYIHENEARCEFELVGETK